MLRFLPLAGFVRIPQDPVIVLGMHRSGTALLARMLAAAGVFMGRDLTGNFESRFFQSLNRDILDRLGCSWSHLEDLPQPSVLTEMFETDKRSTREHIEHELDREYFGTTAPGRPVRWGWKDPRTCVTLPFLAAFFPDAQIVFIRREPHDAAWSLLVRDERRYGRQFHFDRTAARYRFSHYLNLWDEYNRRALEAARAFATTMTIAYEDLVTQPRATMDGLLRALGLAATPAMDEVLREVRADRVGQYARSGDDRLTDVTFSSSLAAAWYGVPVAASPTGDA